MLNCSKTKMVVVAILKTTKIAISPQQLERSLRNLARLYKIGRLTVLTVKKFEFPKSKMADGRQYENGYEKGDITHHHIA